MVYDNILPETVSVQKNLDNGEFSFGTIHGSLTDLEKRLFETGCSCVTLKNALGRDIEYYKKRENAEMKEGVAKINYLYETHIREIER